MSHPSPPPGGSVPIAGRLNRIGIRLVMILDTVSVAALMVGIMMIRYGLPPWPTYSLWQYLGSYTISLIIFITTFYFGGLYDREPRLGRAPVLPKAARLSLAAGSFVALLNIALTSLANQRGSIIGRFLPFPILNLLVVIVLAAVVVAANRWLVAWLRTRREGRPRVIIAGTDDDVALAQEHLKANSTPVTVVGRASRPDEVVSLAAETDATDVLIVTSPWLDEMYPASISELSEQARTTLLRVTGKETLFGLSRLREVGGLPFVLLVSQTMSRSQLQFKRLLDLMLLLSTVPLWGTLLLVFSIYHRIVAGAPLIYRQARVGKGGAEFQMMKFRTMVPDAESAGVQLSSGDDDPRVIPALRWMRSTRVDEMPQLLQVLQGTMSIVGPRPERPELTAVFEREIPGYSRRLEVPPGITGLAQVHGRYHTDAAYKLGYDLQYLVNWSPVLDVEILGSTVWVVVSRRV